VTETPESIHALGHVLVSLSFLGLGATAFLVVAAVDAQEDADDIRGEGFLSVEENERRLLQATHRRDMYTVGAVTSGLATGGLAAIGIVILALTEPDKTEPARAPRWRARPVVSQQVVGLDISAAF
jgi:hypothetical protein